MMLMLMNSIRCNPATLPASSRRLVYRHRGLSTSALFRMGDTTPPPPSPSSEESTTLKDDVDESPKNPTNNNKSAPEGIRNTTSTSNNNNNNNDNNNLKLPIFPWRHEVDPLPRCVPGTVENKIDSQLVCSTSMSPGNSTFNALATAFMFLDVPIYQFLFFKSWKDDLADSVSFAFTQGVASLLSNLSKEPVENIVKDTYELNFHKTISSSSSSSSTTTTTTTKEDDNVEEADDETTTKTTTTDFSSLEPMMEEKLISLFKNARDDNSTTTTKDIEICLKSVPVSAELYSLYCIPYISRQNIQNDKALLEFYKKMLEKLPTDRAPDLTRLRKEYLETSKMESTVVAQVQVWCNELFYVKDVETGDILQGVEGTEGRQNIPHLVRMEKIVRTEKYPNGTFRNIHANWIITDIDDLLKGNLII